MKHTKMHSKESRTAKSFEELGFCFKCNKPVYVKNERCTCCEMLITETKPAAG